MYPQIIPALGGGSFLPQATALFARMSTPPTYRRKIVINRAIVALIRADVWTKLDVLYLFAAADSQAARLNWKSTSYTCANGTGVTFTADRGYTGDGASNYLEPGFTPGNGQFTAGNHTFGRWTRALGVSGGAALGTENGSERVSIRDQDASNLTTYNGPNGAPKNWLTNSLGNVSVTQTAVSDYDAYRNGAALGNNSNGLSSVAGFGPFFILAERNSVGSAVAFSDSQLSAVYFGAALTATETAQMHTALQDYMTAVGA